MKKNNAEKELYKRLKRTDNVGDSEFGNIELSCNYFMKCLDGFDGRYNLKILDVGTNRGALPWTLYKNGYKNVYGVDMREEGILSGKSEYTEISDHLYFNENPNCLPFENESFDVVCMFDVIEHIPDIAEYLNREIRRVLKKEGIFVFQTPNKPVNIIFEAVRNKSFTKYKEYHCSLQTVFSLREMLQTAGFELIKIEKYNLYSELNIKKVKKYFGIFGKVILKVCSHLPLILYPNLWGNAKVAK